MKTVDRKALVEGVTQPQELKKTETKDSSAPKIEGAKVEQVDTVAKQQAIRQGAVTRSIEKGTELKKTEDQHDASAPVIDPETKMKTVDRKALVEGVTQPQELKKTETKDGSAPMTEGAKVGQVDTVAKQQAIRQGAVTRSIEKGTELKKTETKDSSAPVIDPETKMKTVDRKALVEGVTQPQELKKTETKDGSAPKIEGAKVEQVDTVAKQQAIRQGAVAHQIKKGTELKPVEDQHDASAPVIDPEAKIKKVDRKALVEGVTQPQELKKTETKDSSAPVIDPNTKITSGKRGDLLRDLSKDQKA